jgi:hypothetical protein
MRGICLSYSLTSELLFATSGREDVVIGGLKKERKKEKEER